MAKIKVDPVKIIGIAGTVLSLVGTLASGWSNEKKMDETVTKKVNEALIKTKES